MTRPVIAGLACLLAWLDVACSSDHSVGSGDPLGPSDVGGTYSVTLVNGANGCNFDSWMVGAVYPNVTVTFTQNGTNLTGKVEGAAAIAFGLTVGTTDLSGTVSGNTVEATAFGTIPHTSGNCIYTYGSKIEANISGDYIEGTVRFYPQGNGNPDCAKVDCATTETFNGTRPPH